MEQSHIFMFLSLLANVSDGAEVVLDKSCECGIRKTRTGPQPRIVRGDTAEEHEFPWVVGLYESKASGVPPFCTGALISDRHVVTAAHCLTGMYANYVSVGDHNYLTYRDGSKYLLVKRYNTPEAIHPKYLGQQSSRDLPAYDVAVIQVIVPVRFAFEDNVRPLCLPSPFDFREEGRAIVAGWGKTGFGADATQSVDLQYAQLPIWTNAACAKAFEKDRGGIKGVHICAGGEGKDSCQGDSGGAMFAQRLNDTRYEMVGITSFGAKCGVIGQPGGYVRASALVLWIYQQMRKSDTDVQVCNGIFGNWVSNELTKDSRLNKFI